MSLHPVSYTHLDVYKRQVCVCVGGGGAGDVEKFSTNWLLLKYCIVVTFLKNEKKIQSNN